MGNGEGGGDAEGDIFLTIETWVDSLAWERATSPAAPDRRIGRTDGPDRASPDYFTKRPSKFDEINPRSGSPLSSLPLSSSHSPLRWRTRPAVLRGLREMRQRASAAGRSGGRQCRVPPCSGVAGRDVEAALLPSLPLQAGPGTAGRAPAVAPLAAGQAPAVAPLPWSALRPGLLARGRQGGRLLPSAVCRPPRLVARGRPRGS